MLHAASEKTTTDRLVAIAALALFVVGALTTTRILDPAELKDEHAFWPASVYFAQNLPPTPDVLRGSTELSTPLPFIIFGVLDSVTRLGVRAGRLLNLLIATALLGWILIPRNSELPTRLRSAVGLLAFPYFTFCAAHLYTDMVATLFVAAGVILQVRGRCVWAAAALILAVASRQTMVAFPAALLVWELLPYRRTAGSLVPRIIGPCLALLSLCGWVVIYGGLAPPTALATHAESAAVAGHVIPRHALYFLACVGAYHVVPETLLFGVRRRDHAAFAFLWCGAVLLVLFALFPPYGNVHGSVVSMGALDRVMRRLLPDLARLGFFWFLATLAAARLLWHAAPLVRIVVLATAAALMFTPFAWDKYALPTIVLLWMFTIEERVSHVHQGDNDSMSSRCA